MTLFLSLGALLAFAVTVIAWAYRTTGAPTWSKVAAPSMAMIAAWSVPYAMNQTAGYPKWIAQADLPDGVELLAYLPHDADKAVDLWLRVGESPRAYSTVLSEGLKRELRKAKDAMAQGRPAMLRRRGGESGQAKGHSGQGQGNGHQNVGDPLGIGDDGDGPYILDQSAMSALPPKE